MDFVFGTSHFIAQARTLVASPDRKALWEQSDHAPVIAKCLLLVEDGGGISDNRDMEKVSWTSMKGWEAVDDQSLESFTKLSNNIILDRSNLFKFDEEISTLAQQTPHTTTALRDKLQRIHGIAEKDYRLAKERVKGDYHGQLSSKDRRN